MERHTPEHGARPEVLDLREQGEKQQEQLRNQAERAAEAQTGDKSERLEQARQHIEQHAEVAAPQEQAPKERPRILTHLDKMANYRLTMRGLQKGMSAPSRGFSKFIHSPAVERASDVAAKTVMRPSVALGATITSAVVGGFFYFVARHYGYALSGSEFIITLGAGALLGLGLEGITKGIRRLKH